MPLFTLPPELSSGIGDAWRSVPLQSAQGATAIDFSAIPNRRAVYVFLEEDEHVVLVATTAHLRNTLVHRLAEIPEGAHTRAIPYGQFCRKLIYFPAHSPFSADLIFLLLVRHWYPQTFGEMLSWRRPWFVEARIGQMFPRLIKTDSPEELSLAAGPVDSRAAAGRLIETVEELFDLCRYYSILQQAPDGAACAYKDMGKCPAPCDGSISMDQYRTQLAAAIDLARNLHAPCGDSAWNRWHAAQESAMRQAAAQLRFEQANNLKTRLARADVLQTSAFAAVQAADKFCYLALQPGAGRPWIEPFYIHGGTIQRQAAVHKRDLPAACGRWCTDVCAAANSAEDFQSSRLWFAGLLTHHLYRGEADPGLYLPAQELHDEQAVCRRVQEWLKKPPRKMPGDPGASSGADNSAAGPSPDLISEATANAAPTNLYPGAGRAGSSNPAAEEHV